MSPADGSLLTSSLSPYACHPALSRGRVCAEEESPTRTVYQRDRDRIIHSGAFRRLKHKTQVFVYHEGDYYRTRLTHSLEVAQIARSLARSLFVDEDLAEALSLAHDLGHTPFGHAGEEALDEAMRPHGGFDHNGQTLRIITSLEARYAEFDGLNLTWETLEGIAKHNGPLTGEGTLASPTDTDRKRQGVSSAHAVGANFAFADGHVDFVTESIDSWYRVNVGVPSVDQYGAYEKLLDISDGMVLEDY